MAKEIKMDKSYCASSTSSTGPSSRSTGDERTVYYVNYRIEENGVVVSPIVKTWVAREEMYWITYWSDDYTANFVIENNLIFIHTWHRDDGTADYLLLSDQSVGTIQTSGELLNPQNGHVVKGVKPTKETCGPALQVELSDGTMRWLFPHPDGQRAAWEHLCNTTTEDDLIRIAEIGMNIIENHKSL